MTARPFTGESQPDSRNDSERDALAVAALRVAAGFALMVSTALSGWALLEVTKHGERLAALEVTADRNVTTLERLEAKVDMLLQK